jgi:hypothetical protein
MVVEYESNGDILCGLVMMGVVILSKKEEKSVVYDILC